MKREQDQSSLATNDADDETIFSPYGINSLISSHTNTNQQIGPVTQTIALTKHDTNKQISSEYVQFARGASNFRRLLDAAANSDAKKIPHTLRRRRLQAHDYGILMPNQSAKILDDCPNQAHWIFIGVLVGLISGILLLWAFNCFRMTTQPASSNAGSGTANNP